MMKPGTFLCIFMMNGLSFCNFNFKKYLINIHSVEKKITTSKVALVFLIRILICS